MPIPAIAIPALITAIGGLATTSVDAISKETTECGKRCRAKCKAETKTFFGGRSKCKKECKSRCVEELSPNEREIQLREEQERDKRINTYTLIGGILLIIGIGLTLYMIFRKK